MGKDIFQTIRNNMEQKTTQDLLEIWKENDRDQYTDESFDIIQEILHQRGVNLPPQIEARKETQDKIHIGPVTMEKYRGVHGWLLLFCIALTILSPLFTLVTFLMSFQIAQDIAFYYPRFMTITIIDLVLGVGLMIFSIYAGVLLWRVKPNAVRMAKRYLIIFIIYAIISSVLPLMVGFEDKIVASMAGALIKGLAGSIVYFGIWYSYLTISKRVKATYGVQ
jgi:hypothetical protein